MNVSEGLHSIIIFQAYFIFPNYYTFTGYIISKLLLLHSSFTSYDLNFKVVFFLIPFVVNVSHYIAVDLAVEDDGWT